jgi:iron complex outermembrane receptor protein
VRGSVGATRYGHEEYESSGSVGTRYRQNVVQGDLLARHRHIGSVTEGAIGMRYQFRDIVTGGALRTPSTRDQSVAAFVVEQFQAGPLVINAGGRYEWARYVPYEPGAVVIVNEVQIPARPRTFSNLSASLGVLYDAGHAAGHALEGVHVGASVGRAFRTPDFNELYSNGPHLAAYSYDVGNPSLRAETGLGIDVFARLSRERVRGEIALFRNQMRDFIFPRNTGDIGLQGNRPKFQFTGRDALLTGAEGSLEVSATRSLTLDAALSYVRGTFPGAVDSLPADPANGIPNARAGSRYLPLMPPLRGHVGLQYERGRATSRSWNLGVAVRGGAAQRNLGDFESESAAYALLELSAGTRFLVRGRFHAVTLRVDNATDTAWRNHLSRTKDIMPEAGRNLSLLYRVSF